MVDRANNSLKDLKDFIDNSLHHEVSSPGRKTDLYQSIQPRILVWDELQSKTDASGKFTKESMQSIVREEVGANEPSMGEAIQLLQCNTSYIEQLEKENKYLKDEMAAVKANVPLILEENNRLHEALSSAVIQEIVTEKGEISKNELPVASSAQMSFLKKELLETKQEVCRYKEAVQKLKTQLLLQESIPTKEDGLPATVSPVLDSFRTDLHQQTVDRLTRERDELMDCVASLNAKLEKMSYQEHDAYQQIKKGIELVEQAQLEQTLAQVEKQRLAEELDIARKQCGQQLEEARQKAEVEKEKAVWSELSVIEGLKKRLEQSDGQCAEVQSQLEKLVREKAFYQNEVDELKFQLKKFENDTNRNTENYMLQTNAATILREQAVQEVYRLRLEMQNLGTLKEQEVNTLRAELREVKRRLKTAEQQLLNTKNECLHSSSVAQSLEKELHLMKFSKKNMESEHKQDVSIQLKQWKEREKELNSFIDQLKEQNERKTMEADEVLSKQEKLIGRLRKECQNQAEQVEKLLKKNRCILDKLKRENEELKNQAARKSKRVAELEEENEQHVQVHHEMRERLLVLDKHAQEKTQQIQELLQEHSKLSTVRHLLTQEVKFLKGQVTDQHIN